MDAHEIKSRLLTEAEAVCRHLLPGGKLQGRTWKCGSLAGDEGDSLAVEIGGAKAGVWADFATGEAGSNLLELWRAVKDVEFATAVQQAKEWLGVAHETRFEPKRPVKPKPVPPKPEGVGLDEDGAVYRYLVGERKLSPDVLALYSVRQTSSGKGYVLPSEDGTGKLEMWKAISLERKDGKKQVATSKGAPKVLFGKQACAGHTGTLVITEGEIDAMTVRQVCAHAVSVPFGAKGEKSDGTSPNDEWIENDWEWLEQFTTIILCLDNDEAGKAATAAILKRLGQERCRIVDLPAGCKDANDCLVQGKASDLSHAIANARSMDPDELRNARAYAEAIWERMHPSEPKGIEFFLPLMFRVRPSETTIWTGYNGSGKSVFLSHLMVHLAWHGQRICIASFEQLPSHTLHVAVQQASSLEKVSNKDRFAAIMDWMGQHFWIFDQDGVRDWRAMMKVFSYARRRYGITQYVVDSLMKCGIASDDYNEQKRFVDFATNWARKEEVHLHLVAHSRKTQSERDAGGKMDVKGASEITDLASNVVTIWRNKDKEHQMWEAFNANDEALHKKLSEDLPDAKITFSKQRETGDEPWADLRFCRLSKRFSMDGQARFKAPYV